MNKDEIDELFELIIRKDIDTIRKKYGDTDKNRPIEEIYKNIMQRIEQGDYKYFSEKVNDDNEIIKKIYYSLMRFSSKEFAENCLNGNTEKYGLNRDNITQLIKATGTIKAYLNNESLKKCGLLVEGFF